MPLIPFFASSCRFKVTLFFFYNKWYFRSKFQKQKYLNYLYLILTFWPKMTANWQWYGTFIFFLQIYIISFVNFIYKVGADFLKWCLLIFYFLLTFYGILNEENSRRLIFVSNIFNIPELSDCFKKMFLFTLKTSYWAEKQKQKREMRHLIVRIRETTQGQ